MSKPQTSKKKDKWDSTEPRREKGPRQRKGAVGRLKNNQERNQMNNRIRSGRIYEDYEE